MIERKKQMKYGNRITIAYIGGGSVNFGWEFISALADSGIVAQVNLYDTEQRLSLANAAVGNKLREVKQCHGDVIYVTSEKPEEALRNADFAVLSISCGRPDEAAAELIIPEGCGIYQSCGESTGPGAVIKALKTLPVYIKYADMIKQFCPNAWVLTLTNPMAECIMAMKRVFPEMKAVGISGDINQTRNIAAKFASEALKTEVHPRDIKTNLLGISGFSWFDEMTYKGADIIPIFKKYAEAYGDSGYEDKPGDYRTSPMKSGCRIKFDLFLRYGVIPAVSDRIIADYFGTQYLSSPKVLSSWMQIQTTVHYLKKTQLDRINSVKEYMTGEKVLNVAPQTETVSVIRALMGMGNFITNAVLPNSGQVSGLPEGTAVETNALVSCGSVRPVSAGKLPQSLMGITMNRIYNRSIIVDSVFKKDFDIAFNAFLDDPLMTIDRTSAAKLYTDMLTAVRSNLMYYMN